MTLILSFVIWKKKKKRKNKTKQTNKKQLRKQKKTKNMGELTFFLCVYKRRWIILFFLQDKHNINAVS